MPNWCSVDLEIKGTHRQLKKIEKILKGEVKSSQAKMMSTNFDFYELLSQIDKFNMLLKADKKVYKYFDKLVKPTILKLGDDLYINGLEDLLYISYENIEYILDLINKNGKMYDIIYNCDIIDFGKHYIKFIYSVKSDNDLYNKQSDDLDFSRLMPDNPLSFYRDNQNKSTRLVNSDIIGKNGYHITDWYRSRISRLSTKWFPNIHNYTLSGDLMIINMECAWGPCYNICNYLTEIFDIEIFMTFNEPGMCFIGNASFIDGEIVDELYYECNSYLDLILKYGEVYNTDDGDIYDSLLCEIVDTCGLDDYDLSYMSRKELKKMLMEEEFYDHVSRNTIKQVVDILKPMKKIKIRKKKIS